MYDPARFFLYLFSQGAAKGLTIEVSFGTCSKAETHILLVSDANCSPLAGSRSVLVDAGAARRLGAGGGSAAGATLVSTQQQPQSAPAETTENPWDRDDPCSSRRMLFPKEEREDRQVP